MRSLRRPVRRALQRRGAGQPFQDPLACAESIGCRRILSIAGRPSENHAVSLVVMTDDDTQTAAFLKQVGQRLAAGRKANGMSLDSVAAHLGLKSRAAVGHWE